MKRVVHWFTEVAAIPGSVYSKCPEAAPE